MKTFTVLTKIFRNISLVLLLLTQSSVLFSQNVGINTTGATPSQNAILDLNTGNSKNLGLLIPRVVLGANTNIFSPPIANAPTGLDSGMMVYNWQATNQPIGYYYWNGSAWISLGASSAWNILGNAGTTPGTNYAGTSDANAFVIKTNAIERMRFLATGNTGIGTTTPQSAIDVNGNMSIGTYAGINTAPVNGVIVSGQVGIGTSVPNSSAALDVTSTNTGFLPPRMTAVQMNAIVAPAIGLMVLNTTTNCIEYWSGLAWQSVACPCSAPPATPGIITGSTSACASSAGNIYTIIAVAGATSYIWNLPAGAVITTGAGSISITVTFGATSGNITVAAVNSCGTSGTSTLAITIYTLPLAPAIPSGTISPAISTANTYTIAPVVGATGYTWSSSNTNLGAITAGQNTTSATITSTATAGTYTICVYASNVCGNGPASCLTVTSTACLHGTVSFAYTGAAQTWTVPVCISSITVTLDGASGGYGGNASLWNPGGKGGIVSGTYTTVGGTVLNLYVGGIGQNEQVTSLGLGGWNGGGNGGDDANTWLGGGGGGATDIRVGGVALANRIAVAGSGGGGGDNSNTANQETGGPGGCTTAANGAGYYTGIQNSNLAYCGQGATILAGGADATSCVNTLSGLGIGGNSCTTTSGGGGGGGNYGGGAGCYAGGGGGSSLTTGLTSVISNTIGTAPAGSGTITIIY